MNNYIKIGDAVNEYVKDAVMQIVYKKPPFIEPSSQDIDLLNSLPISEVVPLLRDIFDKEHNARMRGRAFYAILTIQGFDRVQFLLDLFDRSSVDWQIACCQELARFPDPRAIAKLCCILLEAADPDLRYTAAESLAAIGDATALPALDFAQQHDTGTDYEGFPVAEMAGEALQQTQRRISKNS